MKPTHFDYIVLGAGVSGLVVANELQASGADVLVLEKSDVPGGVLQSVNKDDLIWDRAAHTIAADNELRSFFEAYQLEDLLEEPDDTAKARQLVINGKISNIEPHPAKILSSDYLSWNAKWKIIKEVFKGPVGDLNPTVASFFQYHFGDEITKNIISAIFSGIYNGDIEQMEMKAVMPEIFAKEQEMGSLIKVVARMTKSNGGGGRKIFGIKGGTASMMQRLAARLESILFRQYVISLDHIGDRYVVKTTESEWTCNKLISTLPAFALAPIVQKRSPELASLLSSITYSSIALLHVSIEDEGQKEHEAFGFLCSQYHTSPLKGAIYNSNLFPSRSRKGLHTFTIFMDYWEDMDFKRESQLVIQEFLDLKKIKGPATLHCHTIWANGIPQFNRPYLSRKKEILALADFELSGSFVSGVSVPNCIKYNQALAKRLISS
ncbi:protoporphyrinogen oxidase [Portibacter marinus]|uniref:protoporphyrinogen oxidase n=1 Tax=Portibacter marinus TaxID=2898660 RepID=UPI001F1A99D8|nr:protoporphyrinogen oxidase [Portibacter marinus]